jgi:uncharacterized damage-inducible protein DinB
MTDPAGAGGRGATRRVRELRDLIEYTRWADRRILDAAATLDRGALTTDLGSSFPSLLETLAHMLAVDWIWLRRWKGESPTGRPAEWDTSSLDAVRTRWQAVQAERAAFVEALDDDDLARTLEYRDTRGTPYASRIDEMLRHVVNHSTYHRGQAAAMLRRLGATPPGTDLITWYRERDA